MSDREHIWIPRLKQYLAEKQIGRREFIRNATLLGMSAGAAYMWAGKITGNPIAPPARAADIPKGGILKISMRIPKIDSPHTFSWIYDSNIYRGVGGYLTRTGQDNVTRPHLLEGWEASEDLKTWKLKIRKDAKWHKGGNLVAEQVAANIAHCLDAKTGSSVVGLMKGYMLTEVDSDQKDDDGNAIKTTELWDANAIEIEDDHTVVLNLKEAQVAVPEHLFHYPLAILDPSEDWKFGIGSNGTEAFELVELEIGRKAILKAKKGFDYYGEGPFLDEVHIKDLGDNPAAEAAALASKQVHGVYEGNAEQVPLYKTMNHMKLWEAKTANTGVARFRQDSPPFDKKEIRQALRLATDQQKCVDIALKGLGVKAEHHHVAPVHPDYKKLPFHTRDVAKAKELLKKAGHENGLNIEVSCKPDPSWELAAVEAMVEQWKDAGINAKINVLPSAKYWEVWDKVPGSFTAWAHRPLGFMVLGLAYRTGVPWNESGYANPEFDSTLTKAEGTLDLDARRELIGKLQTIMQEDGPITQPMWINTVQPMDKSVKGFQPHPTRYFFWETLGVDEA